MKPNEVLTSQERDLLLQRNDLKAWLMVLRTWTLTFGTVSYTHLRAHETP